MLRRPCLKEIKPRRTKQFNQLLTIFLLSLCLQMTTASSNALKSTVPLGTGQTLTFSQSTNSMIAASYDQSILGGSTLNRAQKYTLSMTFRVDSTVMQPNLRGTLFSLIDPSGSTCSLGSRITAFTLMLNPGVAQVIIKENLQQVLLTPRQASQMINHWMFLLISFDYSTSSCYVHLFKYATMEIYQDVVLNYPSVTQRNFQVSNVQLILGSYVCTQSNSETTFPGQIKNIYWTLGSSYPDFSRRQLYLLKYGGFTQILSYYPLQEHEGDTIKDIISGNDGNLGAIQNDNDFSVDSFNPSRTQTSSRKMPILQYNNYLTINFPYMGQLGVDYSKFFIAFWFQGTFAQTSNNSWIFFTFNNTSLSQLSPSSLQFSCNSYQTQDNTITFQDQSWVSVVAVFREQDELILNGQKVQNIEILRGQSLPQTILTTTYINCTTCYSRPTGQIKFGGSNNSLTQSSFVMANIAIGQGSFIDDSTSSIIQPNCQHNVIGQNQYCLKADFNVPSQPQIVNGTIVLQSACTQQAYSPSSDLCERVCSYRCSSCTDSLTCTTCAGNRINPPLCGCPNQYISLEGQTYCLPKDKSSDYAFSGLNDFNLQIVPLTQAYPSTPYQVGNRTAQFNYTNYKAFPINFTYNRIELEAITRLDMVGSGFALQKSWLSTQQIQENLTLYQNTTITQLQTSHFVAASVGQYAQITYTLNSQMSQVSPDDTIKSQSITIEPQTGLYPSTLATPRAFVFLLGFKYISSTSNTRLSIRVSVQNVTASKVDVLVTTNGLIGLQQITLSVGIVRPDHYNYQNSLDFRTMDQPLNQTKFFSDQFVAPAQIPQGTPQVYGIQGFDLNLGTGQRITLDIQQTRYSSDRLTAYFDISSWSDQQISFLDIGSLWFVGDCTYTGENGSGCKNSFLQTDNSLTNTCQCQAGFYNAGSFPYCRSCIDGAGSCSSLTSYSCPANYRQDNVCYVCHYSCATCQNFDQTCLTCSDSSRVLTNLGNTQYCPCKAGFVESGVAACTVGNSFTCDISCLTCSGPSSSQCLSCSTNSNRNLQGGSCLCNVSYQEYGMRNCMSSNCLQCSLQQTSNYLSANQATIESFSLNGYPLVPQTSSAYSGAAQAQINSVTSNNYNTAMAYSSTNGMVSKTLYFTSNSSGDDYFTRITSKTLTAGYVIRRSTTYIQFSHVVNSGSNSYQILGTRQTDKDIFTVCLYQSTGGNTSLYNFVFVPQTSGLLLNQSTKGSNRYDGLGGLSMTGNIFQLVFTEQGGVVRTPTDLSSIADQFMNIINNARQVCCDPLLNFMLSVVDLKYDQIFRGISTNVQSGLLNQANRANNLGYSSPFIQINNVQTDRNTSNVTYVWGVDGHENSSLLGPNVGSLATRNYDNMFFNVMRIESLNYLQVSSIYSDTQPMEVFEQQLWSKSNNYVAYIKMTRVFNSANYPTMVTFNVFRDNAQSGTGSIQYQSFSSNKRSLQVFQNITTNYRVYQLIFFGRNGYVFTTSELQLILDNLVSLIGTAIQFSCGLPNYGWLYKQTLLQSQMFNSILPTLSQFSFSCNWLQDQAPLISMLQVYSNQSPYPLPTSMGNRLTELPSYLGPLGKMQYILDTSSFVHFQYLLDQVQYMRFNFTLSASATYNLSSYTDTIVSQDGETYYFNWYLFNFNAHPTYQAYFIFFSNKQPNITFQNDAQSGEFNVTSLNQELYFVAFSRLNGFISSAQRSQFDSNYINNIVYPAKHYFLHKCPSYNYQLQCGSCATAFNGRSSQWCDSLQTSNKFDDNLNYNVLSSCHFYNNPLLDWTVWTAPFFQSSPLTAYNNMNLWGTVGSTYLSWNNTACVSCMRISTDLAPGVYLPYTSSSFGSRPDITGLYSRYYTQLNNNNFVVVMQLNGVTTLNIDTQLLSGVSPSLSSASNVAMTQNGELNGYDINYYGFLRYNDEINDDLTLTIYIPQHLQQTRINHVVNSSLASQIQVNVQGVTQIYMVFTVMNRANRGSYSATQYPNLVSQTEAIIRSLKPPSNAQCQCTLPNSVRDLSCMQNDGLTPSCYYSCWKCDIYAQSNGYCTACASNSNRQLVSNACPCLAGYFDILNNPVCQICHSSCATCLDYRRCSTCIVNSFRTIDNSTQSCLCNTGYFEDSTGACQVCSSSCVGCASTPTQCTSCLPHQQVNLLLQTCVCSDGFYFDGLISQSCHYSCQTCTGPGPNNCTICQSGQNRQLDTMRNQCVCDRGYLDDGVPECEGVQCDSSDPTQCTQTAISNCNTVQVASNSNSPPKCLKCYKQFFLSSDASTCSPCNKNCDGCAGPTNSQCTKCSKTSINGISPLNSSICQSCEHFPGLYSTTGSSCSSSCGDGIIRFDMGEQCDDGNKISLDGCSSLCLVELNYICTPLKPITRAKGQLMSIIQSTCVQSNGPTATLTYLNQASSNQFELTFSQKIKQPNFCQSFNLSIQSLGPNDFSYTSVQDSDTSCAIIINFGVNLITNQLIKVTFNGSVTNKADVGLQTTALRVMSKQHAYNSMDQKSQADSVGKLQDKLNWMILLLFLLAILLDGAEAFWPIMDFMSWINTLYFINVNYPLNLKVLLYYASWNNMFQAHASSVTQISPTYSQPGVDRFQEKGVNQSFISAVIVDIYFCLLGAVTYLFSVGVCMICERIYKLSPQSQSKLYQDQIDERVSWLMRPVYKLFKSVKDNGTTIAIKVVLMIFLDLQVASFLQIQAGSFIAHPYVSVNVLLAFAFQGFGLCLPVYFYKILDKSPLQLKQQSYQQNYGAIYEDVQTDIPQGKLYIIFSVVKKTMYVYFLTYLYKYPVLQTIGCTFASSMNLLLVCYNNPFSNTKDMIRNLVPEVAILVSIGATMIFAIDDSCQTYDLGGGFVVGWIVMGTMMTCLSLQVMYVLKVIVYKMKERCTSSKK